MRFQFNYTHHAVICKSIVFSYILSSNETLSLWICTVLTARRGCGLFPNSALAPQTIHNPLGLCWCSRHRSCCSLDDLKKSISVPVGNYYNISSGPDITVVHPAVFNHTIFLLLYIISFTWTTPLFVSLDYILQSIFDPLPQPPIYLKLLQKLTITYKFTWNFCSAEKIGA